MRILKEGARLADRYTLIRRLGGGGMAEIWLASDRQSEGRVALKFLAADYVGDARRKELLHREWRIGSRLMHANIVRVFQFHDEPDGAFFALQYVGETGISVLAGAEAAESMRPIGLIADALRYAHGKGVVHRDVKAANILLDSRGLPYLVDFGVADNQGGEAMSGSGSPIAMSPEQGAGAEARSSDDVFALAVLMHELLTGNPPGGDARNEISTTLANGTPMPGAIAQLLRDMLAADPAARPDAETVAARLTGPFLIERLERPSKQ